MKNASSMTIPAGLLVAGLLPFMMSAQTVRSARPELNVRSARVDTASAARRQDHQPDTMEEHPSIIRNAKEFHPAGRKLPPSGPDNYTPAAAQPHDTAANNVALQGNAFWLASNGVLNLKADKVVNNGTGTTGSLRLHLWATQSVYAGGSISGYILGTYQFPATLRAGQYYTNVNVNVPFTAPPDGTYYTTIALEEYMGSAWYIMSYATSNTTNHFGGGGTGGSSLSLQGNVGWATSNDIITITADKVVNSGSGTTGSLRLEIWATATEFGGGTIRGYILGTYQFPNPLGPNQYYYGIKQPVPFVAPPDGTYHTTMTLEEYTSTGWVIRDYRTFQTTNTFGAGGGTSNPADPCALKPIGVDGNPVYGTLTSDSCLNNGFSVDGYTFYATAGSQIQIVMQSADFYTYQALFTSNGDPVASQAEGFNDGYTVITVTAPVTGQYQLLATSVDPSTGEAGGGGQYSLTVVVK